MSKKIFLGPSILYKRPISKNNTSYKYLNPNSNTNRQIISFNFGEEEQNSSNKLISSDYSNLSKINYDCLNPNYKNDKKINNIYPHSYSSRISLNNFLNKNKIKTEQRTQSLHSVRGRPSWSSAPSSLSVFVSLAFDFVWFTVPGHHRESRARAAPACSAAP